jgi:acyl-CoA-binding protein
MNYLVKPGIPSISNENKLEFYALFKQATTGPNNTKSPSKLKIV